MPDTPIMITIFKDVFGASVEFVENTKVKFEYIVINKFYLDKNDDDDFGLQGSWSNNSEHNLKGSKKSFQALLDIT